MARTDTLGNFLTDVADAIRTKKGSEEPIAAADFDTEIENLPSGGAVTEKDVNFYDYDGTLVNSYTKNEFLALNEMPANPTHEGLTAQGWNWNLQDAKTYVTDYGKLNIGEMYNTDDGSVRITIRLEDGRLSPYLGFAVNGTATIDWGDGSSSQNVTGTDNTTTIFTLHNYTQAGEYVISISSENDIYILGSSTKTCLLTANGSTTYDYRSYAYGNSIIRIDGVTNIGNGAFGGCHSLSSITIPSGVTSIGTSAFEECYSLLSVTIPNSVTSINNNGFYNCVSLSNITISNSVTSIGMSTFYQCYSLSNITIPSSATDISYYVFNTCHSLSSVTIPNGVTDFKSDFFRACYSLSNITLLRSVTNIGEECFIFCHSLSSVIIAGNVTYVGTKAFYQCFSLAICDFSNNTSIPRLSNANAFSGIPSDCKIIVPDDLYEDWIAANNWSTYADNIISKSDWDALQNA